MITLTISADNMSLLEGEIIYLGRLVGMVDRPKAESPFEAAKGSAYETPSAAVGTPAGNGTVLHGEVVPPAPKKTRAKRAVEPEPRVVDINTDGEPVAETKPAEPTIEEVRQACLDLAGVKGQDIVFDILQSLKLKGAKSAHEAGKGAELVAKVKAAMEDPNIPLLGDAT